MQHESSQSAQKLVKLHVQFAELPSTTMNPIHAKGCIDNDGPQGKSFKKRGVETFPSGPEQSQRVYTPQAQAKKHKKSDPYKTITVLWVKLSQSQQYEELHQTLIGFQLKDKKMAEFFDEKGSYLLMCALLYWNKPEPLRFICENVPKDVIQKVLHKEQYAPLEGLLLGETALEKKGAVDAQMLAKRFEKISLLLTVDFEGLKAYMESESFQNRYASGVKESFRAAVAEYQLRHAAMPKC